MESLPPVYKKKKKIAKGGRLKKLAGCWREFHLVHVDFTNKREKEKGMEKIEIQ